MDDNSSESSGCYCHCRRAAGETVECGNMDQVQHDIQQNSFSICIAIGPMGNALFSDFVCYATRSNYPWMYSKASASRAWKTVAGKWGTYERRFQSGGIYLSKSFEWKLGGIRRRFYLNHVDDDLKGACNIVSLCPCFPVIENVTVLFCSPLWTFKQTMLRAMR